MPPDIALEPAATAFGSSKVKVGFLLGLLLAVGSTGCSSYLAGHVLKTYQVKVSRADRVTATNRFQEDFVYLKTLGEQVVPLEDRYFPPDKRAAMEREILHQLGQPGCSRQTFILDLDRYLAAFNCEHACVEFNPKPVRPQPLYPFQVHHESNAVYVADVCPPYDRSLLGQRITAIAGVPVDEVEQKLSQFVSAENAWTRKAALEPFGYSQPDIYRALGLIPSATNRVRLDFAGHPAVWMSPTNLEKAKWLAAQPQPNFVTTERPHPYDCRIFAEQNFAYLQFNACFDKTAILDGMHMVNPWFRPLVRTWLFFEFHRKHPNAVLSGILDPERPVLKNYLETAIRDIHRQGLTNLIIDLRHNDGGESELGKQLLYFLTARTNLADAREFDYNPAAVACYDPKEGRELRAWYLKKFGKEPPAGELLPSPDQEKPFFDQATDRASPYYIAPARPVYRGRIVALANQDTHSAASLLAGLMQDNHLATIVGTTTANNPTGPTAMTPFRLPHSGILISLPTEFDERAQPSNGATLMPDYWVENSMADNSSGRDEVFEKALELLGLGGDVSAQRMRSAREFLTSLKRAGQLPGLPHNEPGTIWLAAYSNSLIFAARKKGDSSLYHYEVTRASKESPWKLQRAWRTTKRNRVIETFSVR